MVEFRIMAPFKNDKSRNINQYDSFHKAIMPILVLVQSFGILPVIGISSNDIFRVRYKVKSFRFIYGAFTLICISMESLSSLFTLGEVKLNNIDTIFYRLSSMFGTYQFFIFAKKWPVFIQNWTKLELVFLGPMYEMPGMSMTFKIRFVGGLIFLFAYTEHFLFLASVGYEMQAKMDECNITKPNIIEHYYRTNRPQVFYVLPFYHDSMVILLAWINLAITAIWNFMDIFMAFIGIAISHRIEQINNRVRNACERNEIISPDLFWYQIRTHFLQITDLLDYTIAEISQVIISALACDLYFICLQFFNLFMDRPYLVNYIYFWFSTSFFLLRTILSVYCASLIHDAAQDSMNYLKSVPSLEWGLDLKRFLDHVRWDTIAFSGKKFFFLTRGALLTMAGYIFTYELLLATEKQKFTTPLNCSTV